LGLADDRAEPPEENVEQDREAQADHPRPGRVAVEPEGCAGAHEQQRAGAGDRPVRRLRDEVIRLGAVGGCGHESLLGVVRSAGGRDAAGCSPAALAAPPLAPSTSKKVYDSVIVARSAGAAGSTTKTTGILRTSPGCNVCLAKQKQSSF